MASSNQTGALDRLRALQQNATSPPPAEDFSRLFAQPETTRVTTPMEREAQPPGAMERLRDFRDTLLNETLANNPLQRAAEPVLRRVAAIAENVQVGERSALDIIENVGKGVAIGSVLIPDDAAIDPRNPSAAIQIGAALIGAGAEGAVGELALLRGIGAVAKVKAGTNLGRSANTALRLFGQGEDLSTLAKIGGGAFGGAVTEVGLQTLALQDPEDIVFNAGLVGLGGGILGGAIAAVGKGARASASLPRAARSFAEEFARKPPVETARAFAGADVAMKTPPMEAGMGAGTEMLQRAARAADDIESVIATSNKLQSTEVGNVRLVDDVLEDMFDVDTSQSLRENLRTRLGRAVEAGQETFRYEFQMRKFKSMAGLKELNLSDDFRILKVTHDRAASLAIRELRTNLAPVIALKGVNFTNGWKQFERLVFLRDFVETAERGLPIPGGVTLETVAKELSLLESVSSRAAKEAADNHLTMVRGVRQELIRRGKLSIGNGYDHYVPHVIVEDLAQTDARLVGDIDPATMNYFGGRTGGQALKTPTRPTTRKRLGSKRRISTDYSDVMFRAMRRFHMDNATDDFLDNINTNFGLARKALSEEEKAAISRVGRFVRDGEAYKVFEPTGPNYYKATSVDEEVFNALNEHVKEFSKVDLRDIPKTREILAVGQRKEFILPEAITARLEQFYAPDPFRQMPLISPFLKATAWWKRNTIWWGLSRFFVFQAVGDSVNMLKSNPKAFGKVALAINEQFKHYGTPLMSKEQAVGALAFGIGGYAVDEGLKSGDTTTSSIIAGLGLGYLIGTRRMAGTRRVFSALYDEADELGVLNSGFHYQSEELNRRILGGKSSALPTKRERPWLRGLDTISTIMSGKVHGDPYALARVPAEMIETIQVERENVLRFASYIQQTEKGIHPRIAAKNAREALVDYGKFTEFENRIVRGFMLPFYSFYRHNIPNWIKASVGKEGVGTGATVGMVAVGTIAAADVAVQAWNETFFPEVERRLDDFRRERFHVILGNPVTREPYTDVNGRPMVLGWEMPYEQALEMFGLARPGYAYSKLFGVGGERETTDFIGRARRQAEDLVKLKPIANFALDLLNPIIKEPIQIALNQDLFLDAPIVPERYVGTDEAKLRMYEHVAKTFFRQVREVQRTAGEISGKRFDPLTSAFGLGLPISRVNLDREVIGYLHETMAESQQETLNISAEGKAAIDDLVYSREDFARIPEGEPDAAQQAALAASTSPEEADALWRYYMSRGTLTSVDRHWNSLSNAERFRAFNTLPEWAQTALMFYANGGTQIEQFIEAAEDTNVSTSLR